MTITPEVLENTDLDYHARFVLLMVQHCQSTKPPTVADIGRIMTLTGLTRTTTKKALAVLREREWIVSEKTGTRTNNKVKPVETVPTTLDVLGI